MCIPDHGQDREGGRDLGMWDAPDDNPEVRGFGLERTVEGGVGTPTPTRFHADPSAVRSAKYVEDERAAVIELYKVPGVNI